MILVKKILAIFSPLFGNATKFRKHTEKMNTCYSSSNFSSSRFPQLGTALFTVPCSVRSNDYILNISKRRWSVWKWFIGLKNEKLLLRILYPTIRCCFWHGRYISTVDIVLSLNTMLFLFTLSVNLLWKNSVTIQRWPNRG